jgi:hypothetical protein
VTYTFLSANLHATADAAAAFFRRSRGIRSFRTEEVVITGLPLRPTLHAVTNEHYHLCVEVCETPYVARLDQVAYECTMNAVPLKLYVAFPGDSPQPSYKPDVDRARQHGVGVVEVGNTRVQVVHEALPFSLAAYRPIDRDAFPPRHQSALTDAENTYRNGAAPKGCSVIYDEIEHLTRQIAKRTLARGMWRPVSGVPSGPSVNLDTGPWARVVDDLLDNLDWNKSGPLNRALLKRVAAVTDYRNDAGHKPTDVAQLRKRDRELRTRFESAVDLFRDVVDGSRHLRV